MKLVFTHKEHKDVELVDGKLTIGSSPDADIQIDSIGKSANHDTIITDGIEFSIKVENPAAMASVNGRLVKESKEVREGDLMIVAQVHCKIVGEAEEEEGDDNRTRIRMALPKFVLRGVSGVYFGKTFPLRGKTSLGRHSENDIFVNVDGISRKHAVISVLADGLQVEDMDSSNGTFVNGKQLTAPTPVKIGDEIKLDNIRFLIQSPGMPAAQGSNNSSTDATPTKQTTNMQQAQSRGSGSAIKWIVTVVVLAGAAVAGAWYMGYLDKFL